MSDTNDNVLVCWSSDIGIYNTGELTANRNDYWTNEELKHLTTNALLSRNELLAKALDPRRNIEKECGYPETTGEITREKLKFLYDREPVATRVVKMEPTECWKKEPIVFETTEEDTTTPFEKAWEELKPIANGFNSRYTGKQGNPIWAMLKRADILSGIGSFGVLLIGIADGKTLDEPAFDYPWMEHHAFVEKENDKGKNPEITNTIMDKAKESIKGTELSGQDNKINTDVVGGMFMDDNGDIVLDDEDETEDPKPNNVQLLYLRAFDESLVDIAAYDSNRQSPRYGHPTIYNITVNDYREGLEQGGTGYETNIVTVHWTRVIHIADNQDSSEVFGVSRMRPVYNRLMDLYKLYGGSAEMYWQGAFPGLSVETHPQLGPSAKLDTKNISKQMENWHNHLQRWLAMSGVSTKMLAPTVVDPSPQIDKQLEAICIVKAYPKRIFMGSERGELASSQDSNSWDERVDERRNRHITPNIIVPLIDRFILMSVLPDVDSFDVSWEETDKTSKVEAATVAKTLTDAIIAYMNSPAMELISKTDFLTKIIGFRAEEAKQIVEDSEDEMEDMILKEIEGRINSEMLEDDEDENEEGEKVERSENNGFVKSPRGERNTKTQKVGEPVS